MTAQELFDQLLYVKEIYGSIDVDINVYVDEERLELSPYLDLFKDGTDQHLHSIDLNVLN